MPYVLADEATLSTERARLVQLYYRLTGSLDAAEDLAQETLYEAVRNAHKLHDRSGYARWLASIARARAARESARSLRMLRDLGWLVGSMARTAPLPCALWTAVALLQGLLVSAQLWLTGTLVDALAVQLKGGAAHGTFLWLGLLVGALLVERGLGGVQPWL